MIFDIYQGPNVPLNSLKIKVILWLKQDEEE